MRRLLSVFVMCGVATGVMPGSVGGQETSLPKPLEPLSRLGRVLGVGWGDGYHACDREYRLPTANLPPRSYAAGHALHPHHGQSNRQHWQAAVNANTPPASYAQPQYRPATPPAGSGPQFAVPPSVLQEIQSLPYGPQQSAPKRPADERDQDLPEAEQIAPGDPQIAPGDPQTEPGSPSSSQQPSVEASQADRSLEAGDVLPRRGTPSPQVERMEQKISQELDSMLDGLGTEPADVEGASPANSEAAAQPRPQDSLSPAGQTEDNPPSDDAESLLDGPLDDDLDLLLDDGAEDPLLEDQADLLLDNQADARRFIREPVAGTVRRVPASERVAQERIRKQQIAQRIARQQAETARQ